MYTRQLRNPFDSVYKLEGIIQKASRRERIEWVCQFVLDLFRSEAMAAEEFTVVEFTGGRKRGLSLCDLILMKLEMKDFLLGPWLGKLQIEEEHKKTIRKHLHSHEIYRKTVSPYKDDDPDLTWKAGWPHSSNEVLYLIEAACPLRPPLHRLQHESAVCSQSGWAMPSGVCSKCWPFGASSWFHCSLLGWVSLPRAVRRTFMVPLLTLGLGFVATHMLADRRTITRRRAPLNGSPSGWAPPGAPFGALFLKRCSPSGWAPPLGSAVGRAVRRFAVVRICCVMHHRRRACVLVVRP